MLFLFDLGCFFVLSFPFCDIFFFEINDDWVLGRRFHYNVSSLSCRCPQSLLGIQDSLHWLMSVCLLHLRVIKSMNYKYICLNFTFILQFVDAWFGYFDQEFISQIDC